jgi:ATP-dependent Clp protease adaptor protein ClpS
MKSVSVVKNDFEAEVETVQPQLKEPLMYQVTMFNDDFTPMEFVVTVLEIFFCMDRSRATNVMYEVHTTGKAICGVFTRDIAETKVEQIVEYARRHEHPLLCKIEAV